MCDYDPAFVEAILLADGAPNEAAFDNIDDLLAWLEAEEEPAR
jgi:hypothetical protein